MLILDFTVEEICLIAVYKTYSLAKTIARIDDALPDLLDEDILTIAESAVRKLSALTEPEFAALSFAPADEGDEHE